MNGRELAALTGEKNPVTYRTKGWMGPNRAEERSGRRPCEEPNLLCVVNSISVTDCAVAASSTADTERN
jgi:hypothetical protein